MRLAMNVAALKSTHPLVALYPRVNYNVEAHEIHPGYCSLYQKKPAQVEKGKLINIMNEVAACDSACTSLIQVLLVKEVLRATLVCTCASEVLLV